MTKLGEWLIGLSLFFGIYTALLTEQIEHHLIDDFYFEIQILPIVLIILLGVSDDAIPTIYYCLRTNDSHPCRFTLSSLFFIGH